MENGNIKTFRDLLVWQKSKRLVTNIYSATKIFPSEEIYGLTAQMRRCSISIPSNIAEGYGRHSRTDYVRFLRIASGSLYELETQAEIALDLKYIEQDMYNSIIEAANEIERMLSSLIRKIEESY